MIGGKKKIEYITVPSYGSNAELWETETYLKEIKNVTATRVWIAEVTETVRILREMADNAETPDQLKAYNKCIAKVKELFYLDKQAQNAIDSIQVRKEQNEK